MVSKRSTFWRGTDLTGRTKFSSRRRIGGTELNRSLVASLAAAMLLSLTPSSALAATGPAEPPAADIESDSASEATEGQSQAPEPEEVQARIADELTDIPPEDLEVPDIGAPPADPAQAVGPPPVASVEQADEDWEPGREIASKRTATSKTFTGRVPGELETRVYPQPVHYRSGGRWEAIDSTIEAVGDGKHQSRANSFVTRLSEQADDSFLAELEIDAEHSVAFGMQGAAQSEGRVRSRFIDYSSVVPDTDLRLISTNAGIKEEIILESPEAPHRFVFPLKLKGLSAAIDAQGDVVYTDSKGNELARTPAGYMYDSAIDPLSDEPAYSDGVTYHLIRQGGQVALEVVLDSQWIQSEERVWPIVVDPQVLRGAWPDDTYVMSPFNNNYSMDTELKVGTFNGGANKARSFMHFDTGSLPGVVTYAELQMREMHSYSCSAPPEAIFRVTQGWVGSTTRNFPGPSYDSSGTLGWWVSGSCGSRLAAWNVTGMVQHFQNIGETMGSFAAVATQETNSYQWKKYRSTQAGDGPVLNIYTNYPPGTPNPVTPAAGERVYTSAVPVSARYHDAEGTSGYIAFGVWDTAGTLRWSQWSALMNSGATATATATTSALPDGTYRISTVAWDGQFYSAWAPDQWFTIDTVPPNAPTSLTPANNATVGTTFTASARYTEPTGRAGQILFWVNNEANTEYVTHAFSQSVSSGSTATAPISMPAGKYNLYAYGYDGALSPITGPNKITVATAPGAPTSVQAEPGPESALVTWSPPASNGGSAITGYSLTAYDGTDPGAAALTKACGTGCSPSGGFAFADLTPGHSYTFKVKASNAFGTGPLSSASPAVTVRSTSGYADQVVAVAADQSVQLSWEAQFLATGYIITAYQGDPPGGGGADPAHLVSEETVDAADTTHLIEGLQNGRTYYFTVTPVVLLLLVGQPSEASNPVVPFGIPFAPENVTTASGDQTLIVTWSPPADRPDGTPGDNGRAITGYRVHVFDESSSLVHVDDVGSQPMASVSELNVGLTYTVQVQGLNVAGAGALSEISNSSEPLALPGPPDNLVISEAQDGAFLIWTPPSERPDGTPGDGGSTITGYRVAVEPHCPNCSGLSVAGEDLSTVVSGLDYGATYLFRVFAENRIGEGPSSPSQQFTLAPKRPEAPKGIIAERTQDNRLRVSWIPGDARGSDILEYAVDVAPENAQSVTTSTQIEFSGLDPSVSHSFRVRARNAIGYSDWSGFATEQPSSTAPGSPDGVTLTPGDEELIIQWQPAAEPPYSSWFVVNTFESTNDVQARTLPTFELVSSTNVGHIHDTRIAASAGKRYYVTVEAFNESGGSGPSSSSIAAVWSESEAETIAFELTFNEFLEIRSGGLESAEPPYPPYPYSFTSDGCSTEAPRQYFTYITGREATDEFFDYWDEVFEEACYRHDFGYQNFGRRLHIRQTPATRSQIDEQFSHDMETICFIRFSNNSGDFGSCEFMNGIYAGGVILFAENGFYGSEQWVHPYDQEHPL